MRPQMHGDDGQSEIADMKLRDQGQPRSRTDFNLELGMCHERDRIPIEERDTKEVTHWAGKRVAPAGINVLNPAFDVTPNDYVSAIITEAGVVRPPYLESLNLAVVGNPRS